MSNKNIHALTASTSPTGAEEIPVWQSAATVRVTVTQVYATLLGQANTWTAAQTIANNVGLKVKDAGGTAYNALLAPTSGNLRIGDLGNGFGGLSLYSAGGIVLSFAGTVSTFAGFVYVDGPGGGASTLLGFTVSGVAKGYVGVPTTADGLITGAAANDLTITATGGRVVFSYDQNSIGFSITSSGVVIGSAALATNAANGFLYVDSCAGAPTGTPTTNTGRVPLVVDTTNSKLYLYIGGSWKSVTLS